MRHYFQANVLYNKSRLYDASKLWILDDNARNSIVDPLNLLFCSQGFVELLKVSVQEDLKESFDL